MNEIVIVIIPITLSIILTYFMNKSLQDRVTIQNHKFEKEMKDIEIKANLISKARIEWIQEVRKIISEYLIKSKFILFQYEELSKQRVKEVKAFNQINEELTHFSKHAEKKVKEVNETQVEVTQLYYLLKLYFSDNEGNSQIISRIEAVNLEIQDALNAARSNNLYKTNDETINNLAERARDYLKDEWEVAKKGK